MNDKVNEKLACGILAWLKFEADDKVLIIADNLYLENWFSKKGIDCKCLSIKESADFCFLEGAEKSFDFVVSIGMIEKCREPALMLKRWKSVLKPSGHLLLGAGNRLGLKYFCGEKDPATGQLFQGIENYYHIPANFPKNAERRLYAKNEICALLEESGIISRKCYSVFPNLEAAQFVYAENYLPNEDVGVRILPQYNSPDTVFIDEQHIYNDLIKNGMFHQLANAYLFDCAEKPFEDTLCATISIDRDDKYRTATIIKSDKTVEKIPLEAAGVERLDALVDNFSFLKSRGIKIVDAKRTENSLLMPYIESDLAVFYLRRLLVTNKDKFIKEMDRFRDLILKSSPHVNNPEKTIPGYVASDGPILEKGFVDMVPINAFYQDGDFVFIDQEFCTENYPANAIIFRMVAFVWDGCKALQQYMTEDFFFERYGLAENLQKWICMSFDFIKDIKSDEDIAWYQKSHSVSYDKILSNRKHFFSHTDVGVSVHEDCFAQTSGKQIYMYGSGKFARKFYDFYKDDLDITGVIDSDPSKWGTLFYDKCILPPRQLELVDKTKSKVIICIKDYEEVLRYLKNLGFENIGVYDANHIYPGRQIIVPMLESRSNPESPKKYHIGYIAGVFDLYHFGHLNMFRRAKEQCDYLIAAVVTDRGVRDGKKREPFIPFEERIEMVRSCKYVDEAVEIPYDYPGTVEAFQKYHFDVQFSGSDYVNNSWWLEQQKWLREHGADLVFFPYTQQTSSTKIKALIEKGLL